MADYTKHDPGLYACEVVNHQIGENEVTGADEFRLNCEVLGRVTPTGVDSRSSGNKIKSVLKMDPDKQAPLVAMLRALGQMSPDLTPVFKSDSLFAGKRIDLECAHWTSPKTGNTNEFWNLPRAGDVLKPLESKKAARYAASFAEMAAKMPTTGAVDDDSIPF